MCRTQVRDAGALLIGKIDFDTPPAAAGSFVDGQTTFTSSPLWTPDFDWHRLARLRSCDQLREEGRAAEKRLRERGLIK
jgi:hypothetical protein